MQMCSCSRGAKVQNCRIAELQRCRGAEVQKCRCGGSGVLKRYRGGSEVQVRGRGAEVQRCTGGAQQVQRCWCSRAAGAGAFWRCMGEVHEFAGRCMEEVRDEVHGVACFMVLHAGVALSCMEVHGVLHGDGGPGSCMEVHGGGSWSHGDELQRRRCMEVHGCSWRCTRCTEVHVHSKY